MEAAVNNRCHQGANVRRWREWRGLSQSELADKLGMPQPRLCTYEKKVKLDEEFLDTVAKELDIPLEALTHMEEGATVNVYSGTFSDHAMMGAMGSQTNYSPIFNPLDKLVELYDKMLAERDERIAALEKIVNGKK